MFDRQKFLLKEHVGFLKFVDKFDVLDPQSEQPLGVVIEQPSGFVQFLRLFLNKNFFSTRFGVYAGTSERPGQLLFVVEKPASFLRNKVTIRDAQGQMVAYFESAIFAVFQAFKIFKADGSPLGEVQKDLAGWTFHVKDVNGNVFATISKKFAGVMKALFTSADNYMVELNAPPNPYLVMVAVGMGIAVDQVFHEKK